MSTKLGECVTVAGMRAVPPAPRFEDLQPGEMFVFDAAIYLVLKQNTQLEQVECFRLQKNMAGDAHRTATFSWGSMQTGAPSVRVKSHSLTIELEQ